MASESSTYRWCESGKNQHPLAQLSSVLFQQSALKCLFVSMLIFYSSLACDRRGKAAQGLGEKEMMKDRQAERRGRGWMWTVGHLRGAGYMYICTELLPTAQSSSISSLVHTSYRSSCQFVAFFPRKMWPRRPCDVVKVVWRAQYSVLHYWETDVMLD